MPSEETLPVPVQPPDDPPRQWTCQEQSADMVANFGSMYKTSLSDKQAQVTSQATTHVNIKYSKVTTSSLRVTTSAMMKSL